MKRSIILLAVMGLFVLLSAGCGRRNPTPRVVTARSARSTSESDNAAKPAAQPEAVSIAAREKAGPAPSAAAPSGPGKPITHSASEAGGWGRGELTKDDRPGKNKPKEVRPSRPKVKRVSFATAVRAPVDYIYSVTVTAQRRARIKAALSRVVRDIKLFHAEHERYPKNLEELKEYLRAPLPQIPGYKYDYDNKTGNVSVAED